MIAEHAVSAGNALRRSVTWSAFGMPTTMVSLETNTSVEIAYGPDRQRYRRVDTTVGNANSATTTFYTAGRSHEDPEIGRFLSADPFVQDPSNLQSWNRYSYVINNPLSLTDPSGFFFSGLFKSLWGGLKSMFSMLGRTSFFGPLATPLRGAGRQRRMGA